MISTHDNPVDCNHSHDSNRSTIILSVDVQHWTMRMHARAIEHGAVLFNLKNLIGRSSESACMKKEADELETVSHNMGGGAELAMRDRRAASMRDAVRQAVLWLSLVLLSPDRRSSRCRGELRLRVGCDGRRSGGRLSFGRV